MAPQREWFETDYYKVLDVSPEATDKEITRAYRKLAKQYHPDSHPGSEDRFKEISAAYDVLGDATKRKEYDEVRRLGPAASGFGGGGAIPVASTSMSRTSSEVSSAVVAERAAGRAQGRDRSAGPTSRQTSTCRSTRQSRVR